MKHKTISQYKREVEEELSNISLAKGISWTCQMHNATSREKELQLKKQLLMLNDIEDMIKERYVGNVNGKFLIQVIGE